MLYLILVATLLGGGAVFAFTRPGASSPKSTHLHDSSTSSNQFRYSFLYDPIMNDPHLKARYNDEMLTVKILGISAVREELLALNNDSSMLLNKDLDKVVKKDELDHLLARLRVKHWLMEQQSSTVRASRAQAIREEKEKIQQLGDKEVISELRARKVQFSPVSEREHMDSLLAISRLSLTITAEDNRADVTKKWMGRAADLKERIQSRIKTTVLANDESGSGSEADGGKNTRINVSASARSAVDGLAMTDSERAAKEVINSKKTRVKPTAASANSFYNESDLDALKGRLLSSCSNFDEIVSYCTRESLSRDVIAKMLKRDGVAVPRYAPLSALVNMLADQLLVQQGSGGGRSEKSEVRCVSSSVKRLSDYDEFALERDVFAEASRRTQSLFQALIRSRFALPTNNELRRGLTAISRGILGSKAFVTLRTALSLAAVFIADTALGAARWAGGTAVLKPPQTLSLLCAYALLTRSGLVSFLVSFLVLRFIRVILLSSDIDDSENMEQNTAPQ